MTQEEFKSNLTAADLFRSLSESDEADFWIGYMRGLRKHYHGDNFGTAAEHKMWLSLYNARNDITRKMRGYGYKSGYAGDNIQEAIKKIQWVREWLCLVEDSEKTDRTFFHRQSGW